MKQWDESKLVNCKAFTLSKQTCEALQRTLLCHATLIEDLLADDFDLRSRFQSNPIERRNGQYRQMSGGSFHVLLKDIKSSEKILKIKILFKEGMKIDETVKLTASHGLFKIIIIILNLK